MKEPKVKEVVTWIVEICTGQEEEKEIATRNLESLPIGYFEDHAIPKSKIKHCVDSLPKVFLTTKSEGLKGWCVQLIGELKLSSEESIKALYGALGESSDKILITAVWAIGEIKASGDETERLLIKRANHQNREIRWRVAWALSQINIGLQDTISTLICMLKDSYELCRGYAIIALDNSSITNNVVLNEVEKIVVDIEPFPRETAKMFLEKHKNKF
jgi:hypothetical protein